MLHHRYSTHYRTGQIKSYLVITHQTQQSRHWGDMIVIIDSQHAVVVWMIIHIMSTVEVTSPHFASAQTVVSILHYSSFTFSVFLLQLKTPPICLPLLPPHLLQSTLVLWNKVGWKSVSIAYISNGRECGVLFHDCSFWRLVMTCTLGYWCGLLQGYFPPFVSPKSPRNLYIGDLPKEGTCSPSFSFCYLFLIIHIQIQFVTSSS